MNCCHLDISPENIVLSNVAFPGNPDGTVSIAPGIGLKLVDFGVSELFDNLFGAGPVSFQCKKCHISPDNEQYLSPNIRHQNDYDGRAADMWSIGIIMFFSVFGEYPYKTMEETDFGGYWAIHNGKLEKYLRMENLLNMLSSNMLSLLNGLLNIDETQRLDSVKVNHPCCNTLTESNLCVSSIFNKPFNNDNMFEDNIFNKPSILKYFSNFPLCIAQYPPKSVSSIVLYGYSPKTEKNIIIPIDHISAARPS